MRKPLTERERNAAKAKRYSIARGIIIENAVTALCVLCAYRDDDVSPEDQDSIDHAYSQLKLALEVLRG